MVKRDTCNGQKGTQAFIFEKLCVIRAPIRKRVCLLTRIPFPVTAGNSFLFFYRDVKV